MTQKEILRDAARSGVLVGAMRPEMWRAIRRIAEAISSEELTADEAARVLAVAGSMVRTDAERRRRA